MASPLPHQQTLETLGYFDKYDYPLTLSEIKLWSARRGFNPIRLGHIRLNTIQGYYFLPGRSHLVKLRRQRQQISHGKWQIAESVGGKLKKFPTVAAVFVTGALAMNNSPEDDDIDLMIITYPHTLWITRLFLNLYLDLNSLRRLPQQSRAPDKTCPNLWLDLNNLTINHEPTNYELNLYHAHEILQAKVLWDRANVHHRFLKQNSWVKEYLPVAYKSQFSNLKSQIIFNSQFSILNPILYALNSFLFALQYLYMLPRKTSEKVGLGYAFFHPKGEE